MIWRRLNNLWIMSGWKIVSEGELQPQNTHKPFFVTKSQQAKIVDMKPITSDIPIVNDNSTQ